MVCDEWKEDEVLRASLQLELLNAEFSGSYC